MNFDEIIDRRGTHSNKWDDMEKYYGVSPDDGLAMWVADTDFRAPDCVQDAVRKMLDLGIYGYFTQDDSDYRNAIVWWMENRHGWKVDPDWIFTTHGLGHAVAMVLQTYSEPGDGVVLFTPVYHSFARIARANDRRVVECPLVQENGQYVMDFEDADARMSGSEKVLILCSPHNPGGRVWTPEELAGVAEFCERHDLLLVSDEIHHDLVYPHARFTSTPVVVPGIAHRLVMLTAASKTFNIAGTHTGNVIIPDETLRSRFADRARAANAGLSNFGLEMVTAAYSPEGAAWADEQIRYLDTNRQLFQAGVNAIPGVHAMDMQATYLAWVDFSGTGMTPGEVIRRVQQDARIAASHGETFGTGGETFLRFNLGTQKARVEEAVRRLQTAFSDLQ